MTNEIKNLRGQWPRSPAPKEDVNYDIDWIVDWRTVHGGTLKAGMEAHRVEIQHSRPASTTPADAQPKAARPLGDEAQVVVGITKHLDTLCDALDDLWHSHCKNDATYGLVTEASRAVDAIRAALSAHPTTGQETVATPRDGGVRQALEDQGVRSHRAFQEWKRDVGYSSPSLISFQAGFEAAEAAAISAPGSAGPGERETREWTVRRDALEEAARLVEAWVSQHENNQSLARQIGTNMATGIRDLLALATPPEGRQAEAAS